MPLRRLPSLILLFLVLVFLRAFGVAQSVANNVVTNPVQDTVRPFDFGVLAQGGVGVTEDRGSFRFVWAGIHAGKVLTATSGRGALRGNFEYAVEVFPFWQSYTP